ncbi:protein Flattop [Cottoperca gobio]|uniref:Protein Flattop n=1 Tax=Cottoperca gobio TaxID=56716 RepID=A0A6J2Q0D3_COTGO|nr:protein Flattop [Cottoperca gobio]
MYSYSANQYDGAYKPSRLQNWCETTKRIKERPTARKGHTTFISDDRGHLLPGVVKRGSAWPDFKGTWDLPLHIPAHHVNPTGRSVAGLNRLKTWGLDPQDTGKSQPHKGSKNTDMLQDVGEQLNQTNGDVQKDGAALSAKETSQEAPSSSKQRHKDEQQDQYTSSFNS